MIKSSNRKKIIHCNLMQAYISTAHNPKAAVVIHNTRSCSQIALQAFWSLSSRSSCIFITRSSRGQNLFCTALTNKEAVFGGREKLEQCLFDICRVCRPEYIIVACGCVPGVIGDDVGMVCDVVRAKTGVPILLLPGAGFMVPDLIDMTLAATELLFKEFTYPLLKNGLKKQNTAVIIGLNLYYVPHNIFKEIQEFFSISGIDKFYCPPVGETKKDYKAISSVSLAVSLCIGVVKKEKGKQLAEKFANFMGVSLIDLNKVFSPSELRDAFLQMGKVLECELSIAKHLRYWECFYEKKVREAIAAFHGVSCVIATLAFSQSIQFSDLICFLESLGIEVKGFYMLSPVQEMQRKKYQAFIDEFYSNKRYYDSETDLGIGDIIITMSPLETNLKHFIFYPQHFSFSGWCHEIDRLIQFVHKGDGFYDRK